MRILFSLFTLAVFIGGLWLGKFGIEALSPEQVRQMLPGPRTNAPETPSGPDWIVQQLRSERIAFTEWLDGYSVSVATQDYTNRHGDNELELFLPKPLAPENFRIAVRYAFVIPPGADPAAIARLPAIQYNLELVQLDYDPTDGEVRAVARFPGFGPHNKPQEGLAKLIERVRDDVEHAARELGANGRPSRLPRDPGTLPLLPEITELELLAAPRQL